MAKKVRVGVVTSNKMDKTVLVTVDKLLQHPLYKKIVKKKKNYMAHDEDNKCKEGDKVIIEEIKPRSKKKRWKVKKILQAAKG